MVYAFGLNIPLIELLFIFFIFLAICLIVILIEIRKLRQILGEEKTVVKHFEDDLARFEKDEGKVHHPQAKAYVMAAKGRGMSDNQIKDVLQDRGWDQKTIKKLV